MSYSNENMTGDNEQIGTYSISVKSFFSSWKEKAEKNPIEQDKKRKKNLRPIINPIFEKCAQLTDDNFWQSIFMDCSRGKFPRCFSYKNKLLIHRKGNKMTRLELSSSESEVFTTVKDFFQKMGGILSEQDRQRIRKLEEEKLLEETLNEEIEWKDVKTEKMKDILINEFIETLVEQYRMNEQERKELVTTVKKGLMLKYFTANNIDMENGRIIEIDGLIIDKKTNQSEIDASYINYKKQTCDRLGIEKGEIKPDVKFLDIWEKYLLSLENKRIKKSQTYSTSYCSTLNPEESEDLGTS